MDGTRAAAGPRHAPKEVVSIMSLFIQNDAGTLGTGAVSNLNAGMDVGLIAGGDAGNIGTAAVMGRADLEQVVYTTQTVMDPCPSRLFTLVNTNFGVNADNIDIIILACGEGFTLNDGSLVRDHGGVSLAVGETHNGVNFNPTTSVVVLYDTTQNDGQGFCAKPEDSADFTLQTEESVILYHELSHAFRTATSSSLDGTEFDCASASAEESAAEVDENDMRDQLVTAGGGTPGPSTRRDATNHCGAPCTGGAKPGTCCMIVATVGTGSPFSAEVTALRGVRDGFLRASRVGLDFFERLHTDYYAFSPQVCRLMAGCAEIHHYVTEYYVRPLVQALQLIHDHALRPGERGDLGRAFLASLQKAPVLAGMSRANAAEALALLQGRSTKGLPGTKLAPLLEDIARPSEYVRWALIETLEIYVQAILWKFDGAGVVELDERLQLAIGEWGARLPLTSVWNGLSNRAFREEIAFLSRALLATAHAKQLFAARLPASIWDNAERARILREAGFVRPPRVEAGKE